MAEGSREVFLRGGGQRDLRHGCGQWRAGAADQTRNRVLDSRPVWSPDGRRIAFVHGNLGELQEIYVMNADGTGVTRLTHNQVAEASPAWQPVAVP